MISPESERNKYELRRLERKIAEERLRDSAPDLLKALYEVLFISIGPVGEAEAHRIWSICHNAIAKAKGLRDEKRSR